MDKHDKKEQILKAAAQIFGKNGYHSARIEDIALKADVGKGTVYEYFKSKKQLFEQTITYILEAYLYRIKESVQGIDDPVMKLRKIISSQASMLKKKSGNAPFSTGDSILIHSEMLIKIAAYREKMLDFIADIINEGVEKQVFKEADPYIAAVLFMGLLQETRAIFYGSSKIKDKTLYTMLDYLIEGIGR